MKRLKWSINSKAQQSSLKNQIQALGVCHEKAEQSCLYRLDFPQAKLIVKQFTNGTLYIEGQESPLLAKISQLANVAGEAKAVGNTQSSNAASSSTSASENFKLIYPYIGQDESGKGDYFGAPVVVGVLLDETAERKLRDAGVRDSKDLSAQQISQLANLIRSNIPESQIAIKTWSTQDYNRIYDTYKQKKKTLNNLLGDAHAVVLEELAASTPSCPLAIIDQFSATNTIQAKTQNTLKVMQTTKAERFTAVAAASILARDLFVRQIQQLESEFKTALPLGASDLVIHAARRFIAAHGQEALQHVAKLHFKTTQQL